MLKTTVYGAMRRNWWGWRCCWRCPGGRLRDLGDGAVYMMTNAADGNQLAVFARDAKGMLEFPVFYNTGGLGAGGGLGSQGSIAMDAAGDTLYLVNAGTAAFPSLT